MSEYQAVITYDVPRHFERREDGLVVPAGELVRLENQNVMAYVVANVPLEAKPGQPFDGRVILLSALKSADELRPGQRLYIVSSIDRSKVIGSVVVQRKDVRP